MATTFRSKKSRSSRIKKTTTSPPECHDGNLVTLPYPSRSRSFSPQVEQTQQHLGEEWSSIPHALLEENVRPEVSIPSNHLLAKSCHEECKSIDLNHPHTDSIKDARSSPKLEHAGSIREAEHCACVCMPAVSMRNNKVHSVEALESGQSCPLVPESFGAANSSDSQVCNAKEGERCQALQGFAAPKSCRLDFKAALLREVPPTLNHHQLVNVDKTCTENGREQSQSKIAEIDCINYEQRLEGESGFQQTDQELSQSSFEDSFCHISKEAVEEEYQNDCRVAASPFEHQAQCQTQPCSMLVYDYSQAGVTFVKERSNDQQRVNLCYSEDGASNGKGDKIGCDDQIVQSSQQDDVESPPLFLGFSDSSTRFACSTNKGFRVYDTTTMEECFSCLIGGVGLIELLLNANSLILVGGGPNPSFPLNSVVMWDAAKGKSVAQLTHKFPILAVKARHDRLVVVLENEVFVYNFSNARLLFQVHTVSNSKGLCALSLKEGTSVLACPGLKKGEVRLEHIGTNRIRGEMPSRESFDVSAHDSSLACVALDSAGSLLATASDRGTLVRIFSTKDGAPLQELRRGLDRAEIYSLAFSPSSEWLAASSDKGTVHIFGVRPLGSNSTDIHGAALSIRNPGSAFSFIKGVLPKYFRSEWSYAQFKLPVEMRSVVAFGQEKHSIFVLGTNGSFYKFSFDSEHGGDTKQLECWNFLKSGEQKLL